jgi:MFS transporter, NNP family, nitrate/nitrite transporter
MDRFQALKGKALSFLVFLWFLWFLNFTTRAVFSPILPLIEDEFAIHHATASSLFAFISIGYGLSLFLSGIFAGQVGYKKSICFSMLIAALVFAAIPFVTTFAVLRLLAFAVGLAAGIYPPSSLPLITAYYHEKIWGRTIVIHDSGTSVSIFATPFLCILILQFLSWRGILAILGGVALLSGAIFFFLGPEVKAQKGAQALFWDLLKRKTLWMIGILWVVASGCNLGLYFIFPLYLTKELHMDVDSANTIFGISRLGGIFVAIVTGFMVDRFNLKKALLLILLLTGSLTMSLASGNVEWMKVLLFLQASIAIAFFPIALIFISRIFERDERGQATGLIITLGVMVGIGLIPYLLGLSGDLLSFRFGIFFLGLFTVLSSTLVHFLPESR